MERSTFTSSLDTDKLVLQNLTCHDLKNLTRVNTYYASLAGTDWYQVLLQQKCNEAVNDRLRDLLHTCLTYGKISWEVSGDSYSLHAPNSTFVRDSYALFVNEDKAAYRPYPESRVEKWSDPDYLIDDIISERRIITISIYTRDFNDRIWFALAHDLSQLPHITETTISSYRKEMTIPLNQTIPAMIKDEIII